MAETTDKDLWDEIKKGAAEGFEVLKEEMGKLTKELERHGKIVKKKMDLSSIQRKVHQSFTQLGGRAYELIEDGKESTILTDAEFTDIVARIKQYKKDVESIEAEIETIKKSGEKTK
ncbi:MAG: hypothetical protein JW984_01135 [Deltaproteobacteria bacterium]|uniref:Uncharacterized protein n=1 Tax=Candidatus Zymogenus saltonus TaxID=2844893 RepID=A0A9D8KBZ1_9DELT|nr:hypothetical protein [Candidatus Zymogenus saltonus]